MKSIPRHDPAPVTGRRLQTFQVVPLGAAVAAMLVGAAVLIGWTFDIAVLKSVLPGVVTMKANTAVGLILTGAALGLLALEPARPRARRFSQACACGAVLLGLLTLVEYVSGRDLRIDQLLFTEPAGAVNTFSPGRMGPLTTLEFMLLGSAVLLAGFRQTDLAARLLAILAGLMAILSVSGQLWSANPVASVALFTLMAVHTTLAFIILSAGLLFVRPGAGPGAVAIGGPGNLRTPQKAGLERAIPAGTGLDSSGAEAAEKRSFEIGLLVVTAALAIVITVLGFLYFKAKRIELERDIVMDLGTIADLKAGQIANWRNERLGDARVMMQTRLFAGSAAAFFADPDSTAKREVISDWFTALKRNYDYKAVALFDARGRIRLAAPPAAELMDLQLRALLDAVPQAGDVLVNDLHRGSSGEIHFDVVAPLRDAAAASMDPRAGKAQVPGAVIGAVVLQIDPREFLYPLIKSWPTRSETAETLLVRREGEEVVFLNELRHRHGTALALRRSLHEIMLPAVQGALRQFGVTEGVDYRGVTVFVAIRAIPDTPWVMEAKVDQSEVYGPLRSEAWEVGLIVAALLLSSVAFAAFLWRHNATLILRRTLTAEKERKAAAERLALITQHANDIIFLLDADARILEANDRALSTYGYSLDELRQLPSGGLRPPATAVDLSRQLDLFSSPKGTVFETIHRRKDGTTFPVEVSGRAVEIEGRQLKLSVVRDITERKQAEAALRAMSSRQEAILAAVPDIIAEVDANKVYTWMNPAGLAFFGDDALGREAAFYFEGGQETYETVQPLFKGDPGVIYVESLQRRRDGEKRFLAWWCRVLKDANGNVTGALSTARDITERNRAEDALKESEVRFRSIIESSRDGLIFFDGKTRKILFGNSAMAELLGCAKEDLAGRSISSLHPPEEWKWIEKEFEKHLSGEGSVSTGIPVARKDGSFFYADISSSLMTIEGKSYFSAFFRDITERRQADARLKDQLEELRRWHDATLGREDRVIELKKEVNELCRRLGEAPHYASTRPPMDTARDRG